MAKTPIFPIRLPDDIMERLRKEAKRRHLSMATLVKIILDEQLPKRDDPPMRPTPPQASDYIDFG